MKIKRDEFLKVLELVQFGVPPRETVSFSKSFIFLDGKVCTYDDEILCRAPLPVDKRDKNAWKSVSGAVEAQRLLGILRKLPPEDEEITLEQKGGEFVLSGKMKKGFFRMESLEGQDLPADQVEKPGEWFDLPANFGQAVGLVQDCAKEKDSVFSRTCVHITPEYMQAYDNFQVIRLHMETGIQSDYILIRKEAIKHIASLGMHKFSETDNWVHFKGEGGLVYSCRRWLEQYPDKELTDYLQADGKPITLPKGLEEIIDRANEFSQELADANRVQVEIKSKKVIITGKGVTGRYEESRPLENYKGDEFAFLISPGLLTNIVKKNTEIQLSDKTLVVKGKTSEGEGGHEWEYLAYLVSPDEVDVGETAQEEEEVVPVEEGDEE